MTVIFTRHSPAEADLSVAPHSIGIFPTARKILSYPKRFVKVFFRKKQKGREIFFVLCEKRAGGQRFVLC